MPSADAPQPSAAEPPTTRLSVAAKNAAKALINNASALTQRGQRAAPQPRKEREIESWLGELRGSTRTEEPATQAIEPAQAGEEAAETTAIPVRQPPAPAGAKTPKRPDPEATEKLPKAGEQSGGRPDEERRRGGGVSAQDLLRREGRL